MGATSWQESQQSASSDWQEGLPGPGAPTDDYFIDFLLEATTITDQLATWSEMSQSATTMTEMTGSASTFVEREG